jgi:hypothetical protein
MLRLTLLKYIAQYNHHATMVFCTIAQKTEISLLLQLVPAFTPGAPL